MNAADILKLLERRHHRDVFVPECKSGASDTGYLRVDAWALKRSYTNPCATAYEIKTGRSDFLRDDKWHRYLELCHEFYFVCPHGLIAPEELGEGAGLIYVSRTGTRLYTKRRAPFRPVAIPEAFYWYILFSRARIGAPFFYEDQAPSPDYWRRWLEDRDEQQNTGHRVSREIAKRVQQQVGEVEFENRGLKRENERLQHVKAVLEELGVSGRGEEWDVRRRLNEMREGLPRDLEQACDRGLRALGEVRRLIRDKRKDAA